MAILGDDLDRITVERAVIGLFFEGFDTLDLKEAKTLLAELAS